MNAGVGDRGLLERNVPGRRTRSTSARLMLDKLCHQNDDEPGTNRGATMDVGDWLRNLGFGQYEPTFIEHAIGSDVLPDLTEGDLEKLGIPLGDRKRLIKAIKAIVTASPGLIADRVGGIA